VSPNFLVLWDVDHTLIENGGVSKAAYRAAFELLTGKPATEPFVTDGSTDWLIMEDLLSLHGVELTEELRNRLEPALVEALNRLASELKVYGHELPGARDALIAVGAEPGVMQSVLTGNVQPNGVTKLAIFGLDQFLDFEVGGYGSDAAVRSELVGFAQRRAELRTGRPFGHDTTLLIGDTPRDVKAGIDGGAKVLGVATGVFDVVALSDAGADLVLPDLRDTEKVLTAVRTLRDSV
jgi:phosphoglycolate phosphatase-like HAD superfamily hydrolase